MAISDDTAALVAAQLTQAWATLYSIKSGVGGLMEAEMQGKIAEIYRAFRSAAGEVDIKHPAPPGS